jgi:LPXTG-motif cell wall-anchored protein
LIVNKANTSISITSITGDSVLDSEVTITAQLAVTAPGTADLTGNTVTFKQNGIVIGIGNCNASGVATLITSSLAEGNWPITAEFAGNSNLNGSNSPDYLYDVSKKEQTGFAFIAGSPAAKTYGDTPFNVTASGGQSGGPIVYEIISGSGTISGNIVSITGAGTITVKATLPGNDSYNDATATLAITVEKAPLTVTTNNASKTYGDPDPAFSYTVNTAQLKYSDTATVVAGSAIYNYIGTGVGSYPLSVSGLSAANYNINYAAGTITINKAAPAAIIFPTPAAVNYDPAKTLADIALSGSGDGTFAWAWANSTIIPTVGNSGYTVNFTPNDTVNYDYTGVTLTATVALIVNKVNPPYTLPTPIATYGDALSSVDLPTGWIWEDSRLVGNAGTQVHKAKFTPTDATNYNILTGIDVTVTVNKKAITVTANDQFKYVGQADPILTWKAAPALIAGDTLAGSLKYVGTAVGTCDIVENEPFANPNYTVTFGKGTMTIENHPKTGESGGIYFLFVVLAMCIAGLGTMLVMRRKKLAMT